MVSSFYHLCFFSSSRHFFLSVTRLDTILMERIILGFQIPPQWPIPLLVFMQIN